MTVKPDLDVMLEGYVGGRAKRPVRRPLDRPRQYSQTDTTQVINFTQWARNARPLVAHRHRGGQVRAELAMKNFGDAEQLKGASQRCQIMVADLLMYGSRDMKLRQQISDRLDELKANLSIKWRWQATGACEYFRHR